MGSSLMKLWQDKKVISPCYPYTKTTTLIMSGPNLYHHMPDKSTVTLLLKHNIQ